MHDTVLGSTNGRQVVTAMATTVGEPMERMLELSKDVLNRLSKVG